MIITPARFKTMAFGTDLTGHTDLEIRSVIDQASQLINTYCAVPTTPYRHDFRGGSVTKEQHRWQLPDLTMTDMRGRRVYPYHSPVREITGFRVKFTNTYQVTVDPANLYVNQTENWAEVVSIAAVISGVYPVGINFGLYTPIAEIDYTYGWQFPVVGEILSPLDATIVYQATNQFWLFGAPVTVRVNDVVVTTYTYDIVEGTVTFNAMLDDSDRVTLDYTYTLPAPIALACGHLTATFLNEGDLVGKGLGNLASIRVEEVELRRTYRPDTTQGLIQTIDPAVAIYLSDYLYLSVR